MTPLRTSAADGLPTTVHVARARQGDADSLSWLVRRLSPWLLLQARYRLGRLEGIAAEPEDLVQDTWLAALPRLGELGERAGRRTPVLLRFLGQVLANRVADLIRRRLRGREEALSPHGALADVEVTVTDALGHIERREQQARLEQVLATLPATARELLILRGVEQVPYGELEMLLGVPANTLAVRYRRLRVELVARLGAASLDELAS